MAPELDERRDGVGGNRDRDGVMRSIVLEGTDTAPAITEASRLFEESPADAESDVAG